MALKSTTKKNKETLLFVVGSLLLFISFILFHFEKILEVKNDIYNSIQQEIYKENVKKETNKVVVNVNVDYVTMNKKENSNETYTPNYIAFLEIDKINLRQGILEKNNYYNYVDYHVQILDVSDYPDKINGNFILAGHSGTSNVAYFKNLYKLEINDTAKVYYQNKIYNYKIVNIYQENKDGSINIYRDTNKSTMTLITCTKDDKLHQTIYILELIGVETY